MLLAQTVADLPEIRVILFINFAPDFKRTFQRVFDATIQFFDPGNCH